MVNRKVNENIVIDQSNSWKYRRISKEAMRFTRIFNDFIIETRKPLNYQDYFVCLRSHLLLEKFSSRAIKNYINQIVIKNLNEDIESNKENK